LSGCINSKPASKIDVPGTLFIAWHMTPGPLTAELIGKKKAAGSTT
jgi:hypothetical protein